MFENAKILQQEKAKNGLSGSGLSLEDQRQNGTVLVPGTPTLTINWRRPWCLTETVPSAITGAATGRYGSGPWNTHTNC